METGDIRTLFTGGEAWHARRRWRSEPRRAGRRWSQWRSSSSRPSSNASCSRRGCCEIRPSWRCARSAPIGWPSEPPPKACATLVPAASLRVFPAGSGRWRCALLVGPATAMSRSPWHHRTDRQEPLERGVPEALRAIALGAQSPPRRRQHGPSGPISPANAKSGPSGAAPPRASPSKSPHPIVTNPARANPSRAQD